MSKTADTFNRSVRLSPAEKTAMDDLGANIPCLGGPKLSEAFAMYLTLGWNGHTYVDNHGEHGTRFKLYTPLPGDRRTRMPQISFSFNTKVHAELEDSLVNVDFVMARGPDDAENWMIPVNIKAPRTADGKIDTSVVPCPMTKSVLGFIAAYETSQYKNPKHPAPETPSC